MLAKFGIGCLRLLALLPLSCVRGLGSVLGLLLYVFVGSRRRIVMTNLALCFPDQPLAQRRRWARACCVYFAQTLLDRAWLWHGKPDVVSRRLRLTGAVHDLHGDAPTVIFAPHFFGLDAAGAAVSQQIHRPIASIYMPQRNKVADDWLRKGRMRFGDVRLFERKDGSLRSIVATLRAGGLLYLLPDMNYGRKDSLFVPFFGVNAATVPSLPRFARLGKAKVVPVTARLTESGYDIEVHPAWVNYPTEDEAADTDYMNRWLEGVIATMPAQYYWVHKRFKTRPKGDKKKLY
ncbi:lysophospholipid acyltransferase family protein [Hylemonella gracilis]|uniref:Lipid A biosynthesis acyltransferase n=1 Tax=Hylemonella gracilis ATCC 19624 TaxID=887062 RepID=F3KS16_9BURK|nr:lipid A biosynthesis acyltransferase [Hylemonella gracilis]EGI77376.1 lipid A biosynthesis acyltransferase [Hylemonella gracilis ATCC 19624]